MLVGYRNKQIGGALGIGEKTVKMHRARLKGALGVETSAEVIRVGLKQHCLLAIPVHGEAGNSCQQSRPLFERAKMVDRLLRKHLGLPSGPIQAEQGDEIFFALASILAEALPDGVLIAAGVKNVVGDLKRKAQTLRIAPKTCALLTCRCAQGCSGFDRPANNCAGFQSLQPGDGVHVFVLGGRKEVKHLPAGHAIGPRCRCQVTGKLSANLPAWVSARIAQDLEGNGEQGIAGEDRRGFIISQMDSRLASPQIVVIHARQVIMDERMNVNTFHCETRAKRHRAGHSKHVGRRAGKQRPQSFAAADCSIAHRLQQS
jgi:hypothetical protein